MHKTFLLLCMSFIGYTLHAQQEFKYNVFQVQLTDKVNTPYSVFHPEDFLSPRAIERRQKYGIAIDETDLPIDPVYIAKVKALGLEIRNRSKWMNSLAVYTKDSLLLEQVKLLPFVQSVSPLGFRKPVQKIKEKAHPAVKDYKKMESFYGHAKVQTEMLGGNYLHDFGYRGAGMQVAIFDGGFKDVYRMPVFDSLRKDNRIIATKDFVEGDDYVYESSTHGTNVLSTMGANLPHLMVGTAPDADYYLCKTEDVKGEFRIEEFNWLAAAEWVDSLGIDVINSSLGYTGFDDKRMSYKYEDMNGQTALISRAANMANQKGILVVNSAGNEGFGKWHYIGAPADAPGTFSIGAVRADGKRAYFSSWGPTFDGRIKPDVVARGQNTAVTASASYNIATSNGTSFSSPVMAGMVSSLWQAETNYNNEDIKDFIRMSGHLATEPDSSLGFGIPNFVLAYISMQESFVLIDRGMGSYERGTVVNDKFSVIVEQVKESKVRLELYSKTNQLLYSESRAIGEEGGIIEIQLPILNTLADDVYTIRTCVNGMRFHNTIVKKSKD